MYSRLHAGVCSSRGWANRELAEASKRLTKRACIEATIRDTSASVKGQKFTIEANDTGSRLAPPTSTPSFWGCTISVFIEHRPASFLAGLHRAAICHRSEESNRTRMARDHPN